MNRNQYAVTLMAHLDGTFTTVDSDIRGLNLSTGDFRSMRDELIRVGSRLLRTNHNLTDDQVGETTICVSVRVEEPVAHAARSVPRISYAPWASASA